MTRSRRLPLSPAAWSVLAAVRDAGGVVEGAELVKVRQGSWTLLVGSLGALESRGLIMLRGSRVGITRGGRHALARRFAH